jgi:hypothetical protein
MHIPYVSAEQSDRITLLWTLPEATFKLTITTSGIEYKGQSAFDGKFSKAIEDTNLKEVVQYITACPNCYQFYPSHQSRCPSSKVKPEKEGE